jgi:hypothetical protein
MAVHNDVTFFCKLSYANKKLARATKRGAKQY